MKLALIATLLTFTGSLAGFGLASADGGPANVAQSPPAAVEVVDVARDDCPKPRRAAAAAERT